VKVEDGLGVGFRVSPFEGKAVTVGIGDDSLAGLGVGFLVGIFVVLLPNS
jgi:hypothetical protein